MPKICKIYEGTKTEQLKKMLRCWDAGYNIRTIEMSGMGTQYECAVQTLAMEIVRDKMNDPLPDREHYRSWAKTTIDRVDKELGLSGASVGAGKTLAYKLIENGPTSLLEENEVDSIFVNKNDIIGG